MDKHDDLQLCSLHAFPINAVPSTIQPFKLSCTSCLSNQLKSNQSTTCVLLNKVSLNFLIRWTVLSIQELDALCMAVSKGEKPQKWMVLSERGRKVMQSLEERQKVRIFINTFQNQIQVYERNLDWISQQHKLSFMNHELFLADLVSFLLETPAKYLGFLNQNLRQNFNKHLKVNSHQYMTSNDVCLTQDLFLSLENKRQILLQEINKEQIIFKINSGQSGHKKSNTESPHKNYRIRTEINDEDAQQRANKPFVTPRAETLLSQQGFAKERGSSIQAHSQANNNFPGDSFDEQSHVFNHIMQKLEEEVKFLTSLKQERSGNMQSNGEANPEKIIYELQFQLEKARQENSRLRKQLQQKDKIIEEQNQRLKKISF